MELRQLEHFLAVAQEESFTRAARRMNIAQSGLSMSIRALERELDTELFARAARRVTLTPSGRALLPHAQQALHHVDYARRAVEATDSLLRGTFVLGTTHTSPPTEKLAELLGKFHLQHPQVRIRVVQDGADAVFAALKRGKIDLAVCAVPRKVPKGLTMIPLMQSPMSLACSASHRLAARKSVRMEEVREEHFVDVRPGWVVRQLADQLFEEAGLQRMTACEVDDAMLLMRLVEQGIGVAMLPEIARQLPFELVFIPIEPVTVNWHLVAAFTGAQPHTVAARVFLDQLRAAQTGGVPGARVPAMAKTRTRNGQRPGKGTGTVKKRSR